MIKKILSSNQGMTLVEVMIAILIIGFAALVFLGGQMSTVQQSGETRARMMAVFLAQKKMVEKDAEYSSRILTTDIGSLEKEEKGDFGQDYPGYTWEHSFKKLDFSIPPSLLMRAVSGNFGSESEAFVQEDPMMTMLSSRMNEFLKDAGGELVVTVSYPATSKKKTIRTYSIISHIFKNVP